MIVAGISAKDVKGLRDQTGAGMMDCKNALTEAEGDLERAIEILREKGLAKAGKRSGRETTEGAVAFVIDGGRAAIIELACETDFVAKTDDFQGMATSIASAVLAAEDVNDLAGALATSMDGKSIEETVKESVGKLGENIQLKRVRTTSVDGVVGGYVHAGGKLGVLVALTGSPDAAVAKDIAMHVAAHDPTPIAITRDEVDAELIESERRILRAEALQSGKPEKVVEKIVDGRINKYYKQHCLLEQEFVKDPDQTVEQVVKGGGDGVRVSEFIRFQLGESTQA